MRQHLWVSFLAALFIICVVTAFTGSLALSIWAAVWISSTESTILDTLSPTPPILWALTWLTVLIYTVSSKETA